MCSIGTFRIFCWRTNEKSIGNFIFLPNNISNGENPVVCTPRVILSAIIILRNYFVQFSWFSWQYALLHWANAEFCLSHIPLVCGWKLFVRNLFTWNISQKADTSFDIKLFPRSDKIEPGIPNIVNIPLYNTFATFTESCDVKGTHSHQWLDEPINKRIYWYPSLVFGSPAKMSICHLAKTSWTGKGYIVVRFTCVFLFIIWHVLQDVI